MVARNRTRNTLNQIIGTYTSNIGPTTFQRSMTIGEQEVCDDHVGNLTGANTLQLSRSFKYYPTLSGSDGNGRSYNQCPIGYQPGPPDPRQKFPAYTNAQKNELAWKILSETNPSLPHVSVPQVIGEMKDLPGLVNGYGKSLLKSAATGYLSWRWCVRPMIGDITKMMHFTEAVNQRLAELRHLRDGKALKRRVQLGVTELNNAVTNTILHSEGSILNGTRHETFTAKVWGSAEWILDPNSYIPELDSRGLESLARRLALGLTSHEALATAWELTPWSWFVDWFSNVGDMIAATNNSIPCTFRRLCLMRHSVGVNTVKLNPATSSSWPVINGWYSVNHVRKERHPVFPVLPVPVPTLPIIDNGKWSILAALATLRALR